MPATSSTETGAGSRRRSRPDAHIFFFVAFAALVILIHFPFLDLPFFWDEAGQFIPAALDIYQRGAWVPRSAAPNVHPPGVMAYLAAVWQVTGFSILSTRVAMLMMAAVALWLTFVLAIRLCRGVAGAPAFTAVLLVLLSPLFYTQAMMAQLDMPAMLFTLAALLAFLSGRVKTAALLGTALVLVKETGIVVPLVLAGWLVADRRFRDALWLIVPPLAALAVWLGVLWNATGFLFGNPEFARYNVAFAFHPVRILLAIARRGFYLAVENFHWIGWIAVIVAWRRLRPLRVSRPWKVAFTVAAAHVLAVSVIGGAVLERYLLPVLPLLYIAFAAAWSSVPSLGTRIGQIALLSGLVLCLFWNPPYPYPFENNLAMVDFVRLHQRAADFIERNYPRGNVVTAWPLAIELRRPSLGYVRNRMAVTEIPGFTPTDIASIQPDSFDVLVLFSRDWQSAFDPRRTSLTRGLTRRVYGYVPAVTPAELERKLPVRQVARWDDQGQFVIVYQKLTR